jgi:hypothetical protein
LQEQHITPTHPGQGRTIPDFLEIPPPGDGRDGVSYALIPGHPANLCGTDGSVWSRHSHRGRGLGDRWRRLRASPGHKGYLTVKVGGKTRRVHEIILLAFVGPKPPGLECRHLDGNPANCALSNLAWGTHLENEADKARHGTDQRRVARRLARAGRDDA